VNIGLLGYGTVGRAVLKALEENRDEVWHRVGEDLTVTRILVRHPERHPDVADRLTTRVEDILNDPSIAIVVEVMGGLEPARTYMVEALTRGKAVVTANKEVLSEAGQDLFQASDRGGADLFFEASVGGGMPVVQGLKRGLHANRVERVTGILNGTTNYILTQMALEGMDFAQALRLAQSAGYAEADPGNDVEGHDAARKLAILASIGFGSRLRPDRIVVEGMTGVGAEDIAYGRARGWVLKLVADARLVDDALRLRVGPTFLPADHPLAHVDGVYNAVLVAARPVGDIMFYGAGAGGGPTASAVLGDVIEAADNRRRGNRGPSCTCYRELTVLDEAAHVDAMYWRLHVVDRPGTLRQVVGVLSERGISLSGVDQRPESPDEARLILVTHPCRRGDLQDAWAELRDHPAVTRLSSPIPVWGGA
jgi:homoserine dehydrogenase